MHFSYGLLFSGTNAMDICAVVRVPASRHGDDAHSDVQLAC